MVQVPGGLADVMHANQDRRPAKNRNRPWAERLSAVFQVTTPIVMFVA